MNVRLVENKVNSHVGSVMVVNVASQNRVPGMMVTAKRTNLPRAAHKVVDPVSPIPA